MTAFVLDCAIACAWLFDDEASPETDNLLASDIAPPKSNAKLIIF